MAQKQGEVQSSGNNLKIIEPWDLRRAVVYQKCINGRVLMCQGQFGKFPL